VIEAKTQWRSSSNGREGGLFYWRNEREIIVRKSVARGNGIRGRGGEEGKDAAAEFFRLEAEGGAVIGAGDNPELFGAAGGGVDPFRVSARQRDILFIANEENRKGAGGDGFFRGDLCGGESGERFAAVHERPAEGREERFSEKRGPAQAGVVV